jgi:hypothetical protein
MILLCKAGQPELVVRNALALTGLANFRLVGKPYLGITSGLPVIGGKLQMERLTSHKPISRDSVLPDVRNTTAERRGRAHTHRLARSHFA